LSPTRNRTEWELTVMYIGTSHGTFYVDDRDTQRYCFTLVRLISEDPIRLDDEVIGTVRLAAEEVSVERVRAGMRQWALATLVAGAFGFGKYEVSMGVLDADDEPDDRYGRETITWDGTTELVPAAS
jgi:hypothetical protein